MSVVPSSWSMTTIGDVCDVLAGYGFPERLQGRSNGDLGFFKVGDISESWKRGEVALNRAGHYISNAEAIELRATPLPPGTTVFAKIGAAIALNRRAMLTVPSLVDNNVMGLYPNPDVLDSKYLFYFTCTLRLNDISQATTVPSIRKGDVKSIPIPVPPKNEQGRIASEIEKELTRLDAAVAALKRVRANLKRYRAAVLKAACEGRLVPTEAELARKEGRPYETGEQLLARILQERRAKWEADQLARMFATGKPPKDDSWKKKYKEPVPLDVANLPCVPEGWVWTTVEALGDGVDQAVLTGPFGTHLRSADFEEEGVPVLTIGCLTEHGIDLANANYLSPAKAQQLDRYSLKQGDLLFSRMASVGRAGKVGRELEGALFNYHIMRLRLNPAGLAADYYMAYVRGSDTVREYVKEVNHGATRDGINTEQLLAMPVALPPASEQQRIRVELDRQFSILRSMQTEAASALRRADRLRQSILKRAFEGKLVPPDPNDEPASVLLKRIKAERPASAVGVSASRRRLVRSKAAEAASHA